jgi:hypothetical protein
VRPGTAFYHWGETSLKAGDAFGKTLRVVDEMKQNLIDAGFVDVVEKRYKWPIGGECKQFSIIKNVTDGPTGWPEDPKLKQIGLFNKLQWETGIEGWSMFLLTHCLGWSVEEVNDYLSKVRGELRDKSIHAYHEM